MNAVTPIRRASEQLDAAASVNLTAIFEREGIKKVQRFSCYYTVVLFDGRVGTALSVGEALVKAKAPGAFNVGRAAA